MALTGFVEAVEAFQVRGWVWDPSSPRLAVTVEVLLHGRVVGSVSASLYREDLEKGGIGSGEHAFIFNFEQKLDPAEWPHVSVRGFMPDGSFQLLATLPQTVADPVASRPVLQFEGQTSDPEQYPVFVLGAARSGTSAMAQGLLKLGRYSGYPEGHLLDLLAYLSVGVEKFSREKFDEIKGGRNTAAALVSREYFVDALDSMFIDVTRRLYPRAAWLDKTPNSNMIYLAPRFRRIWPNSRFIFMKRRFLENAVSRSTKFPGVELARHVREWNQAMRAWLEVRSELSGAAIEVDQRFLSEKPAETADAVGRLLSLSTAERDRLAQAFAYDRPERTSEARSSGADISELGWRDDQTADFRAVCTDVMSAYGYSVDASYFLPGLEANGLVWL